MGLRENAAAAAGRTLDDEQHHSPADAEDTAPLPDPMADYEPGDNDPDMVPVHLAWLRVRRDIRAIGKGELYNQSGTRFNFRGVDTVVNVFGPVTLKHGVHVMSSKVEATYGTKNTKSGGTMRECSVLVTWTILGPMGDTFTLQTMGEALDTADKSTTKAQSVALRTLLLGFGLTPTHDTDPDADRIERGVEAPARSAESYRDEILDKKTSQGRLQQIGYELANLRMLNTKVPNETNELETLDALGQRIYKERAAGGGA
ncbi:ERF family protein [Streptomyces sp. NBC_00829]|uniref:ERF family protein n=1 Tax=Streptomyces sp. NBC_00829 TaxID=2903679 RepID=UPI0038706F56|nr:ERF family protein [Streptomyces sp. NBC_00829]